MKGRQHSNWSCLLLWVCLLLPIQSLAAARYALVIGNADYPEERAGRNDLGPLTHPKADANGIARLLKQSGFTLVDQRGLNRPVIDASKRTMDEAVDRFIQTLKQNPGAEAVIYFSGHGVYLNDLTRPEESANYLLPVGQNYRASEPAAIKYAAVNAHAITRRLGSTQAQVVMILDTCREQLDLQESHGFGRNQAFLPMEPGPGIKVVYATRHAYRSWGKKNKTYSRFTGKLLELLPRYVGSNMEIAIGQAVNAVLAENQSLDPAYWQVPWVEGFFHRQFCWGECKTAIPIPQPGSGVAKAEPAPAPVVVDSHRSTGKSRSYRVGGVDFKLVRIPEGRFMMGSNNGTSDEKPVHRVSISSFYMMEHEVTFDLWDACVSDGKCERPNDEGWGRGSRPVINVSWDDITKQFIPWLNRKTGKTFRLPSESEWEYAARAGTTTKYSWGDSIGRNKANCNGCGSQWDDSKTAPVKSFSPNAFGLYDMHGNVWEWVQDCRNDSYNGAPDNGNAWESGDCKLRVLRGSSWYNKPTNLRSAYRNRITSSNFYIYFIGYGNGFRLVQAP